MLPHGSKRLLILIAATAAIGTAQGGEAGLPALADGTGRYVVQFQRRSFDLAGFRAAIRRRAPHREVAALVAGLENAVDRDQAEFVAQVRALGGRVTAQWWLVNGCAIELPADRLPALRALPNVLRVDPDRVRRSHLADATNGSHHASDQANAMRTRSGAAVTGKGVAIAVLDTGADAVSGTTGRPHRCYYPNGDPSNNQNGGIGGSLLLAALKVPQVTTTEDATGHGTGVAGCAAANRWNNSAGVDHGIAPGAGVVSVNVATAAGVSLDSWMVSGWQLVAGLRMKHNIGVGNNSFQGSPLLSNVLQIALDSAAYNADMLICVSAGNSGASTKDSQHAYNGLAVGAVDKTWLSKSAFSAIGPLTGTRRTYPDITAVGSGVVTVLRDDESRYVAVGGTSYAAPLVAGAAALVRQAAPQLTAAEVRALLLNTTLSRGPNRNHYGIGFMKADALVAAALNGEVTSGTLVGNRPVANFTFTPTTSGTRTITVAWMRQQFGNLPPNLDLRVYDGSQLVVTDGNPENSYESVAFTAVAHRTYRAEVTWVNAAAATVSFAIAGVIDHAAPKVVKLTPSSFASYTPGEIELSGDALATATAVTLDGRSLPFTVMDDTVIRVQPPIGLPIGVGQLVVKNPAGTSNPQPLTVTAPQSPVLAGDPFALKGNTRYEYRIYSDRGWRSLLAVSLSSRPSRVPNLFDLGIGNNFTELVLLLYLNQDAAGASSVQFAYPTVIPSGTQLFYQAMTVDPQNPTLPFPATNVLPVKVF